MRRQFGFLALLAATACLGPAGVAGGKAAPAAQQRATATGVIRNPGEGQFLAFCAAPHLDVTVMVSAAEHASSKEMGTARLAAGTENFGRHKADEIVYFVSGRGFATLGDQRRAVTPGSTMFVPRGVRNGFENTGAEMMEFVWVSSPPGFVDGIRGVARSSLGDCPATSRQ